MPFQGFIAIARATTGGARAHGPRVQTCRTLHGKEAPIGARAAALRIPPETETSNFDLCEEVRNCLALARRAETAIASGQRLAAARTAVELVRAYDRVLEDIRLIPLSQQQEQRVRAQLTPVAGLLRKYRFR